MTCPYKNITFFFFFLLYISLRQLEVEHTHLLSRPLWLDVDKLKRKYVNIRLPVTVQKHEDVIIFLVPILTFQDEA